MTDFAMRMKQASTAAAAFASALLARLARLSGLDEPRLYRPEAHYMRGPGPKCRAKFDTLDSHLAKARLRAKADAMR